ncbi:MAG: glutamyl-tRNA reductase [Vicinamibacterales bacterium]
MRDVAGSPDLLLLGRSHRVAGVAERECLARSVGQVPAWLSRAREAAPSVTELLILATCHRLELYAVTTDRQAAEYELRQLLGQGPAADVFASSPTPCVKSGIDAIQHLARVASGLESVILGEAEIAGQVRRAATLCRASGSVGPYLDCVIAGALRASGRARSETQIAKGVMSAASAAVALAMRGAPSLGGRTALVIGAGQAGRQALLRLSRLSPARLFLSSRSPHHAQQAAAGTGAQVVPLEALTETLRSVDLLIAAAASPVVLVEVSAVGTSRAEKPLTIVDISVPRVIDPAVGALPGVSLRSIDDLGDIARASVARRAREVPAVESIVRAEAERAYGKFRARSAAARPGTRARVG